MFCPKCGKMNPDDREFCSGCNAVLHEQEAETPKRKRGAAGKIAALAAAAAIVVGAGAAAIVSCDSESSEVVAEACFVYLVNF